MSFPYAESFLVTAGGAEPLAELAAAAAFSINLIFSFSCVNTLGNEKNGMETRRRSKPPSKKPPHQRPTHL